jgi:hypothetical protein
MIRMIDQIVIPLALSSLLQLQSAVKVMMINDDDGMIGLEMNGHLKKKSPLVARLSDLSQKISEIVDLRDALESESELPHSCNDDDHDHGIVGEESACVISSLSSEAIRLNNLTSSTSDCSMMTMLRKCCDWILQRYSNDVGWSSSSSSDHHHSFSSILPSYYEILFKWH